MDEKISDSSLLFLPQEQRAASEGSLRGRRGPDANQTEVEAALASSQAQGELGSRVKHGRDILDGLSAARRSIFAARKNNMTVNIGFGAKGVRHRILIGGETARGSK